MAKTVGIINLPFIITFREDAHDFCKVDSALMRSKNRRRKRHKEKFMTFPIQESAHRRRPLGKNPYFQTESPQVITATSDGYGMSERKTDVKRRGNMMDLYLGHGRISAIPGLF